MALPLQPHSPMVSVARVSRSEPGTSTLILSVETKGILLLDRPGAPTSCIAPAIRVGYIPTAVIVDERGDVQGLLTAALTVDPGQAGHLLTGLGATQTAMRGGELAVVGLIADDGSAEIVRGALHDLRTTGECTRWIEVLDPSLLRGRLARLMSVLEPVAYVREEILGSWDLALTFEPGAIDDVIGELQRRTRKLIGTDLAATESLIDFMDRHRTRADYGALRRRGIEIPVPVRRHHEYLPLRMTRARCRPITVER